MAAIQFHKTNTLPGTLANSSVYFIPGSTGVVEQIITGTTGAARYVAPVGNTTPANIAATGNAGTSDVRARADHTHGLTSIPSTTTATTQAAGDNSTKVATTAFVMSNVATTVEPLISGATGKVGVSTLFARADHQHIMPPSFNIPNGVTASTQTANDNSTKIATTAYVATAVASIGMIWGTEEW